jgi:hypothetical protein
MEKLLIIAIHECIGWERKSDVRLGRIEKHRASRRTAEMPTASNYSSDVFCGKKKVLGD